MIAPLDKRTFDYIVVGAGSAGCVLAARLSEDPLCRVLLLEAGGKDSDLWLKIPIGYGRTIARPDVNWMFETETNKELVGRKIFWPRGKVLGGSSSINGLIYIRGQAADYDLWRQEGNVGWGYDDVLPYFRKAEDQENGADTYHGAGGPLRVSNLTQRNPLYDAYLQSAQEIGIPYNPDFNGPQQEGVGYYQATIRNGRRASASSSYLGPARKRPNLTIYHSTPVDKILFEGRRACGVLARKSDGSARFHARREVILSAGSVKSPQLLMLSGIGDGAHLKDLDIEIVNDLPGVGQNLQDHYGGQVMWRCNRPITLNDIMLSRRKQMMAGAQWILFGKGPLSVPAGQAGVFTRVMPESASPDVQFLFSDYSGGYYEDGLHKFSGFTNFVCPLRPRSRGEIRLGSPFPDEAPKIFPNYFFDPVDRKIAVEGVKLARNIAATGPLASFIVNEVAPGSHATTDQAIEDYLRQNGGCVSHQVGTCRMGQDATAVVDERLRVRGVTGLRVIDASIMPRLVSGNTNAAAIMIGEKGADLIRGDNS